MLPVVSREQYEAILCQLDTVMAQHHVIIQLLVLFTLNIMLSTRNFTSRNKDLAFKYSEALYSHQEAFGEDYIVRGQNVKKLEDRMGAGFRRWLEGQQKYITSFPWVAVIKKMQKCVIWTYKGQSSSQAASWPPESDFHDLEAQYVFRKSACSGVLILPKVLLTSDHCFWVTRIDTPQYWKHPDISKYGKYRLYKGDEVKVQDLLVRQ